MNFISQKISRSVIFKSIESEGIWKKGRTTKRIAAV